MNLDDYLVDLLQNDSEIKTSKQLTEVACEKLDFSEWVLDIFNAFAEFPSTTRRDISFLISDQSFSKEVFYRTYIELVFPKKHELLEG